MSERTYQGPDLTDVLSLNGTLTHGEVGRLADICESASRKRLVSRAFGPGGLHGFNGDEVEVVYAVASHLVPKDEDPRSDIREASLRVRLAVLEGGRYLLTSDYADWPLRELVADYGRGFFNPDQRDDDGARPVAALR